MTDYGTIQQLVRQRESCKAELSMSAGGTPEVKERNGQKYLYLRRKIAGRFTSVYVGVYSELLFEQYRRSAERTHELKKELHRLERMLDKRGYSEPKLTFKIFKNLKFAKSRTAEMVHALALLMGAEADRTQVRDVVENNWAERMKASDVQTILRLKDAWTFALNGKLYGYDTDESVLRYLGKLLTGTATEPIPVEGGVRQPVEESADDEPVETAISLCVQVIGAGRFGAANEAAAVLCANRCLLMQGEGILLIPESDVPTFRRLAKAYRAGTGGDALAAFLREHHLRGDGAEV